MKLRQSRAALLGALGIVCMLGLWQLIAWFEIVPARSLPSASTVLQRLVAELGEAATWNATFITLGQAALATLLCIVIAVPFGMLVGRFSIVDRYTRSTIDFLRAMPGIALVPLFLLFVGATNEMVIFLAAFVAVWPLLIQVIEGASAVEPLTLDMAQAFRLGRLRTFARVILPATMPSIITGLRLALTVALMVSIGAGLLSGAPGIGQLIAAANIAGDGIAIFAFAVWSGVLGVVLLIVLRIVEKRVLAWHYARVQTERAA